MKGLIQKQWLIGSTLAASSLAVNANELSPTPQWTVDTSPRAEWLRLASADEPVAQEAKEHKTQGALDETSPLFKEHLITASKIHKYLGIGSLGLAGLTLLAPKEPGNSLHHHLGQGAAAFGVGAVVTGILFHWDDIDFSQGLSNPDNVHALLTTLGTLGYLGAVSSAPDEGHGALGAAGAASMAIGIKMTW